MAISRASAAAALARVESDPAALERFLSAYTGDEDAVAALKEAADPAHPSASSLARTARLAEYSRAAYGRTSTPDEEAAAAEARDEIAWEEDHRRSVASALEVAVAALEQPRSPAVTSEAAAPAELEAPEAPRRRLSTRSIVAVAVIGGLILGLAIAGAVGAYLGANRASASPDRAFSSNCRSCAPTATPARSPAQSSVTRTYTTKQIAGWFAATSTSDDTFPQPNYLEFIGLGDSDTRFIATADSSWSLWIGKSTKGETCLLLNGTTQAPTTSRSSCLSDAAINQGKAVVIGGHRITATLTKRDLVVSLSSS